MNQSSSQVEALQEELVELKSKLYRSDLMLRNLVNLYSGGTVTFDKFILKFEKSLNLN